MITRINLIEKKPFQLNYQKLVFAFVGLITLLALLYGVQFIRVKTTEKKLAHLSAEIARLKAEREKLLKSMEPTPTGSLKELAAVFEKAPRWSEFMEDLSRRLPETVWWAELKTVKKDASPSGKGVEIKGTARDPADLTTFINHVKESPFLAKLMLVNSQQEPPGFTFMVSGDIVQPGTRK